MQLTSAVEFRSKTPMSCLDNSISQSPPCPPALTFLLPTLPCRSLSLVGPTMICLSVYVSIIFLSIHPSSIYSSIVCLSSTHPSIIFETRTDQEKKGQKDHEFEASLGVAGFQGKEVFPSLILYPLVRCTDARSHSHKCPVLLSMNQILSNLSLEGWLTGWAFAYGPFRELRLLGLRG